jgi:multidrug efflux system outer membrane protein
VISILIGRPPAPVPRVRRLGAQIVVAAVPAGLPSRLLEQRPDVRQAGTQLAAAAARIGVAKADYFPRVFLTGAIGVGGLVLNGQTFGPQGLFSILPSATVPIFNSGRVGAGVEAARARAEAAVLQYQQTILTALQDVSHALAEYRKRREARAQQEALTVATRETTRLANTRYTGGVTPYLEGSIPSASSSTRSWAWSGSSATRCWRWSASTKRSAAAGSRDLLRAHDHPINA